MVTDKFCGEVLGPKSQLTILSIFGKNGYSKIYNVFCSICSEDTELFGDGIFTAFGSNLKKGYLPCGCGKRPLWTEDQFKVLCNREALRRGFVFYGWAGDFVGNKTLCKLSCNKHGDWNSTDINHFFMGRGCPGCKSEVCSENAKGNTHSRLEDSEMISKFMNTGGFSEGTLFRRCSLELDGKSADNWEVSCPDCNDTGFGRNSNLSLGYRPCACTKARQKFSYINGIYSDEHLIALKYGIAVNPEDRVKKQNLNSIFSVRILEVWEYPDYKSCRNAETEIKRILSPILKKEEMLDGYSETTDPENLELVTQIYQKYGGWRVPRSIE